MPHRLHKPAPWQSLRYRGGLAVLLLVSAIFALVTWNTQRVLAQAALENSRTMSRQIAQVLNLALAPHTTDAQSLTRLTPFLQELISADSDSLLYLVLLDEAGAVLTRTEATPDPLPPVDSDLDPAWRRGVLHLQQPILLGNQQIGRLRYGLSSRLLRDAAQGLFQQHLLLYGGVLALVALLVGWVMRRLSRRLQALTDAGAQLASGNYATTAPTPGRDELTLLGHELNLMADAVRSRVSALEASQQRVHQLNEELELRVAQRTAELSDANAHLAQTLVDLRRLQDGLVQSEKLASLGALVAAVAHELNTPIGNALSVATAFSHKAAEFEQQARERLQRQTLSRFLDDSREAALLLERNLLKASELITSFKHVAIDQTSSQRRRFDLAQLVGDVLATLSPSLKHRPIQLTLDLADGITLLSFPGPLGQVLTNLVNNALLHAFAPEQAGTLHIASQRVGDDRVLIRFSDDGCGMDAETLRRVFDPFFTTRLGQGGSGLGMHIVHNIVVGLLQGRIDLHSAPGAGTRVTLQLPLAVDAAAAAGAPAAAFSTGAFPTVPLPTLPVALDNAHP